MSSETGRPPLAAQLALVALTDACTAAAATLAAAVPAVLNPPPLPILTNDLRSLLTLVYTDATKIALTLRPSAPAYAAAPAPTRDLTAHITALATCAVLFSAHGATLAEDIRRVTHDVVLSTAALARACIDAPDDYLVRTGAVHAQVEHARTALPADNRAAVRARWAQDRKMLEDTLTEIAEMIDGDEDDADGFADGNDDEWDELGLGAAKKMSAAERERTKTIQPLLRFCTLLHKRVILDLLGPSPAPNQNQSHNLDALPAHSHSLLLAAEDLIAALYAPQDLAALREAVTRLASVAQDIHTELTGAGLIQRPDQVGALTQKLAGMQVGPEGTRGKEKDVNKWFGTCFEQIEKLSKSIGQQLADERAPNAG